MPAQTPQPFATGRHSLCRETARGFGPSAHLFEEKLVDAGIFGQFGMKCRGHMPALLNQNGITMVACQHPRLFTHPPDNWRPNENRLHFTFRALGLQPDDPGVQLPAVPVPLNLHVHHPQRGLWRIGYIRREQNRAGTGAQHRMRLSELPQRLEQSLGLDQLQHGGALASGDHQGIQVGELLRRTHLDRLRPGTIERFSVRLEISLQREHTNPLSPLRHYQPLVCSSSPSGSREMSRPGIAMPSSSLASSSFAGSLKYVAAFTTARARASGSDDLKIPEPTNTASAPSCMTSAASAGVAIPPAEKLGTGSFPCSATYCTSSSGACSFFDSATSSSLPSTVSCFISLTIVRM